MSDRDRIRDAVAGDAALTWVITGDSIGQGLVHTGPFRNYGEHLAEALRGELWRTHDAIINTAVGGWRLGQVLDAWERKVADWNPDVVLLMTCGNDCSTGPDRDTLDPEHFGIQLGTFITDVRAMGAIPLVQVSPAPLLPQARGRERFAEFAQTMRTVCEAQDALLIDHAHDFAQLAEEMGEPHPWVLMSDAVHPNAAGHAHIARALLRLVNAAAPRVMQTLDGMLAMPLAYTQRP